jgi:hypothetical protein
VDTKTIRMKSLETVGVVRDNAVIGQVSNIMVGNLRPSRRASAFAEFGDTTVKCEVHHGYTEDRSATT